MEFLFDKTKGATFHGIENHRENTKRKFTKCLQIRNIRFCLKIG